MLPRPSSEAYLHLMISFPYFEQPSGESLFAEVLTELNAKRLQHVLNDLVNGRK
jgi:hypothetical protein